MHECRPAGRSAGQVSSRWCWAFWALMLGGGLGVLQVSSGQIRVTGDLAPFAWTWSGMLAAMVWSGFCVVAAIAESGTSRPTERWMGDARSRVIALWPVGGLLVIAVAQAALGFYHFAELPAAIVAIGWCIGRLSVRANVSALGVHHRWGTAACAVASAGVALFWYNCLAGMTASGHLGYPDIGAFASRLINTARGTWPLRENPEVVPFWDHFNPALYLLTPPVRAVDAVALLNAVGAICAAAPALVWYGFARRRGWGGLTSVALGVGWLLVPGVSHALFSMSLGFHPVIAAMPLVALSLVLLDRRKWIAFGICALLACALRETVALSYVGMGLWMVCVPGRRRAGGLILACGAVYFLVVTLLVIPYFRHGTPYLGEERFAHLGGSAVQILLSPVLRPGAFWGSLFSEESVVYAAVVFACVGLIPIVRGGRRLLMLVPEGLFLLLWNDPLTRSIAYQYNAIILVLLYWISLEAIPGPGAVESEKGCSRSRSWAWALVGSAAAGSFFLGWWPGIRNTTPFDPLPSRRTTMTWIHAQVSERDTVAATRRAATHCAHAAALYLLPDYDPPRDDWPDVFVLDYADDWGRLHAFTDMPRLWHWQRRLAETSYAAGTRDAVVIFRRHGEEGTEAPGYVDSLPPDVSPNAVPIPGHPLTVLGWTLESGNDPTRGGLPREVHLAVYLRVESRPSIDLAMGFALRLRNYPSHNVTHALVRPAGGVRTPSSDWPAGRTVVERASMSWYLDEPPSRPELMLVIELYDLNTGSQVGSIQTP